MRALRPTVIVALLLAGVTRAATLDIAGARGAHGTAGAPELGIAPGQGGAGGSVSLTADGPDSENTARARGGLGGQGGWNGGVSEDAHAAGVGGTGGHALAVTSSSSATGPVTAWSTAIGGLGGTGGNDGFHHGPPPQSEFFRDYGRGGDGGDAHAESTARSSGASATARSSADAGYTPYEPTSDPSLPWSGGAVGEASAHAVSEAQTDSIAWAGASGSHAVATSDSTSVGRAEATASASGVRGWAAQLESSDWAPVASATARSLGAGDAIASASSVAGMRTGTDPSGSPGPDPQATARAYSDTGHALASASVIAAEAQFSGGPGGSIQIQDLVAGGSRGSLSLSQSAMAPFARGGYGGGSATSLLNAVNPAGGDIAGHSEARAGAGGADCIRSICLLGPGGDAHARVEAHGPASAVVQAHAEASGGWGGGHYGENDFLTIGIGGTTEAIANATGGYSLLARAESIVPDGSRGVASATASGPGPISATHVELELAARSLDQPRSEFGSELHAFAGIDFEWPYPTSPTFDIASGRIVAQPKEGDLEFLEPGPNVEAALAELDLLALGGFSSHLNNAGGVSTGTPDEALALEGMASIDFSLESFADRELSLAFLQPHGPFSLLELSLTRDGAQLFDAAFAGNADSLDDLIVDLGEIAGSGDSARYALHWRFEAAPGFVSWDGFFLTFAFLGTAVPEPPASMLAALLALGALARVTASALRDSGFH